MATYRIYFKDENGNENNNVCEVELYQGSDPITPSAGGKCFVFAMIMGGLYLESRGQSVRSLSQHTVAANRDTTANEGE